MAGWWQATITLFCGILSCVHPGCSSSPVLQRTSYSNSLRLTRFTRTRVQQLLNRYKEQQLGDKHFEDKSLELRTLPILSTDYHSWLQLKDWERLHAASKDLHTYWDSLEQKRRQLEREGRGQRVGQDARRRGKPTVTIPKSIENIQLDLRDLMRQVNSQLRCMNSTRVDPTSPPAAGASGRPASSPRSPYQTLWASRLEGYVIIRDLNLYLTKLARDFLLLASKQRRNTQGSQLSGH